MVVRVGWPVLLRPDKVAGAVVRYYACSSVLQQTWARRAANGRSGTAISAEELTGAAPYAHLFPGCPSLRSALVCAGGLTVRA